MSKLWTYEHPWSEDIVGIQNGTKTKPGDFVSDKRCNGFGILVSQTNQQTLVLWSIEPTPMRYNPLSIEEDIWIPIRNNSPAPSPPRVFPFEKDSWFKKQFKRVLGNK